LFGGFFLSLSYFGVDQSQVQRYISGGSLRESRLGLMFNAVFKIPMQFFILLLGVMLFVFYQFEKPPIYFNERAWNTQLKGSSGARMQSLEQEFASVHTEKEQHVREWLAARHRGDHNGEEQAKVQMAAANEKGEAVRTQAELAVSGAKSAEKANDADYVFISFILRFLPHGLIGLLISAFFAATLSSKAAELNALGSATTVDLYRHVIRPNATDAHYLAASKWLTLMWGVIALAVALYARLVENLIQAVNIVGSIFYGVLLGLFVVAFFVKRVGGTAVFWGALAAQTLVVVLYACRLPISYLWYNLIGCAACVVFSLALQAALGHGPPVPEPQPT
jgi:Na+/proline symporter